jgi:hypothetical protein
MLTRQMQMQIIVDFAAGLPLEREYAPEEFDGHMATAWLVAKAISQSQVPPLPGFYNALRQELVRQLKEDGLTLAGQIERGKPSSNGHAYLSLYDLAPTLRPVSWLWEHWLPSEMLCMLAARPGTGKSLLALDLIRMIISGTNWPDGSPQGCAGSPCIYVDAENVPAILNQRALEWEAWGMDRRKVFPLLADEADIIVDLSTNKYADLLWDMAYRLKPALIVVDSLRDILPAGESALEDVRDTLAFLSSVAVQNHCAVLVIHHLRKGNNSGQLALLDSVDMDQVSGSGHIIGRSRVVMGLTKIQAGPTPDKNGPRKLEVVKTNLGAYPEDIGIVFEQIPPEGLRLVYGEAPTRYQEPTEQDDAKAWLLEYLEDAGEPMRPADVVTAAKDAGYSRATVYRAREDLRDQIMNTGGRKSPDNKWTLVNGAGEAAGEA